MSPQILSLIVFAENIHLNLNRPTKIAVCAPGFNLLTFKDCQEVNVETEYIFSHNSAMHD
jgi:hypothetical protein